MVLLEIYLAFQQWKNFENPLRIDKVIAMSSVCSFFCPTLYIDRRLAKKRASLGLGLLYSDERTER